MIGNQMSAPAQKPGLHPRNKNLAGYDFAALTAIAPDRAEAISLYIFGGLSMAEIGSITGRSESAAKMLGHRALSDLRQRLEHLKEG